MAFSVTVISVRVRHRLALSPPSRFVADCQSRFRDACHDRKIELKSLIAWCSIYTPLVKTCWRCDERSYKRFCCLCMPPPAEAEVTTAVFAAGDCWRTCKGSSWGALSKHRLECLNTSNEKERCGCWITVRHLHRKGSGPRLIFLWRGRRSNIYCGASASHFRPFVICVCSTNI